MPFFSRRLYNLKSGLLLAGLAGMWSPGFCTAEDVVQEGMNVTMTANIVENTCQISLSNNGAVHLPLVSSGWFYNSDGTSRLQPNDAAGGTLFSVNIESCAGDPGSMKTMIFRFQPQNGIWPAESKQVFINDAASAVGNAQNVGIVVFSSSDNRNVVNSDGSSSVAIDVPTSANYLTSYDFYARYQNTGIVSAGKVTSHVLVDAIYQ